MNELIKQCINDNTLVVCPTGFKDSVLEYLRSEKMIRNIRFMTLEEFRKNCLFDYDLEAVRYLMNKESLSNDNARELIENLYYVGDTVYNNDKLDHLVSLKQELESKGLLKKNPLFIKHLKNVQVVAAGYGRLDRFSRELLGKDGLQFERVKRHYILHSFNNMERETERLYNGISDLLRSGVDINKIFVLNASDAYESYFKRYNSYYGFTIEYGKGEPAMSTETVKTFVSRLEEGRTEAYEYLTDECDEELAEQLINVLNRYCELEIAEALPFIKDDLQKMTVRKPLLDNTVKCASLFTPFERDDHVFMVGFNDRTPAPYRDTDYLSDNEKRFLNLSPADEMNFLSKENMLDYLSTIDNLYLSVSLHDPFNEYRPSSLLENMDYETICDEESFEYSDILNRMKYAVRLDDLNKYDEQDHKVMARLHRKYGRNSYLQYDNTFKGLSDSQISALSKPRLSYSSMETFYECQFRYYLEKIVEVMKDEGNFNTKLGTICHNVLQDSLNDGFDFEKSWTLHKNSEGNDLTAAEEYFLNSMKEELWQDVDILQAQKARSGFTAAIAEKKINIKADKDISFVGYIDKLLIAEKGDELIVAIVDYKTGSSAQIKRELMEYGLCLQLPSYMYLLRNDAELKDKKLKFAGFYLQYIIGSAAKYDEKSTAFEQKQDSMKLDGFTSADPARIEILDNSLAPQASSLNIKGLKMNKDGSLGKNSKLLLDEDFDSFVKITESKVKEAGRKIMNGEFTINPKIYNTNNISCSYCPFDIVCYRRTRDNKYLTEGEVSDDD